MPQHIDVHKEFASFFHEPEIQNAAFVVSKKLADGHTCVNLEKHNREIQNSKDDESEYGDLLSIDTLAANPLVAKDTDVPQPFVLHDGNLYLHRYFTYETDIVDRIKDAIVAGRDLRNERMNELESRKENIKQLFGNHTTSADFETAENINWQLVAALTALMNNFSIITGGPGTGKTTTVAKLLALLFGMNSDLRVALAAPTGKAAARMMESLKNAKDQLQIDANIKQEFDKMEAATIHRLLGYKKNSPYFRHNADNPLRYDVIIVDESSMIGVALMAKLLTAVKSDARIILLGDKDQLASVEAGSIFGDICLTQANCMNQVSEDLAQWLQKFDTGESCIQAPFISTEANKNLLQEHIIELKRSHRFKSNEGIGKFSKAVISGQLTEDLILADAPDEGEYVQVCEDYQAPELHQLMDHFEAYIQENDIAQALDKLNRVRFLCAVRNGHYGVYSYNKLIEAYLQKKGLVASVDSFYEHQPIMITQNDYNLGLFNGDVGIIRKDEEGQLKVWFEDAEKGIRSVNPAYIKAYETVYAMTIHKSQGSEFDHVAMVLPDDGNSPILTRELIYTGITRAKKSVVIFTPQETLFTGVEKQVERASGITQRFMNQSL